MSPEIASPIGYVVVASFGAVVGSFLNVCIARIPNGESIVYPISHCPKCRAPIAVYDNIPLISYLVLHGQCRSCLEPISSRYFFVELFMGLLAAVLYYRFGLSFEFLVGFVFVGALLVISFIDLAVRIVPDAISLPGIIFGLLLSVIGYFFVGSQRSIVPSPVS